ncbi:MAG: HipA N-terminal domain-containing protein, partial [Thaumarchaeota archaeon]|nr:HipA N-terminal domain-containing protein [Nitrososphaerota archaeon]
MTNASVGRLGIFLNELRVGALDLDQSDGVTFEFDPVYLAGARRPVLGQWFLDRLGERIRSGVHLPPFFSNLLPEGRLRELIASRARVHPLRELARRQPKRTGEFHLLAIVGDDLPGAVRA